MILLLVFCGSSYGFFESCSISTTMLPSTTYTFYSQNYPNQYPIGSSCRYYFLAPSGTNIILTCTINLNPTTNCPTDSILVAVDGNTTIVKGQTGVDYFCGTGTFQKKSIFNELVMAYTSAPTPARAQTGAFNCSITSEPQACDCGWSIKDKIVGGTVATMNQYPSMAGITYKSLGIVVCGGAISKTVFTNSTLNTQS